MKKPSVSVGVPAEAEGKQYKMSLFKPKDMCCWKVLLTPMKEDSFDQRMTEIGVATITNEEILGEIERDVTDLGYWSFGGSCD
jgi:hypothetical protein